MKGNFSLHMKNIDLRSKNSNIFIIGKGRSIDDIDQGTLHNSIVINLNDSFELVQGDIIIANRSWALEDSVKIPLKTVVVVEKKLVPDLPLNMSLCVLDRAILSGQNDDLLMHRFINKEIAFEDLLFVTALKVAYELAKQHSKKYNVYILGLDFDFDTLDSYSSKKLTDKSGESEDYKRKILAYQESVLNQFLYIFTDNAHLSIHHVGVKNYSALNIYEFNNQFKISSTVTESLVESIKQTTDDNQVLIVAELTTNHLGDRDLLIEMVRKAYSAGANLIKVQKRDVDTFYSKEQLESYYYSSFGLTLREYRHGLELSRLDFIALDDECTRLGINWFASALDHASFEFLKEFEPLLLKIPSTISNHRHYHQKIADSFTGSIVLSTGLTDVKYENYLLDTFKNNEKVYLLQCTSSYPTKPDDCQIAVVRHYRDLSRQNDRIIPGFSSHDLGSTGSMLAVAAGAKMIEKHVKLGVTPWVHFDSVAIDLSNDDFKSFVSDIRLAETMCGTEQKCIQDSECHKYPVN